MVQGVEVDLVLYRPVEETSDCGLSQHYSLSRHPFSVTYQTVIDPPTHSHTHKRVHE